MWIEYNNDNHPTGQTLTDAEMMQRLKPDEDQQEHQWRSNRSGDIVVYRRRGEDPIEATYYYRPHWRCRNSCIMPWDPEHLWCHGQDNRKFLTDLRMADTLMETLMRVNRTDAFGADTTDVRWYAIDNTQRVYDGEDERFSPYAHVSAALKQALFAVCEGNIRRAQGLERLMLDNQSSATDNIRSVMPHTTIVTTTAHNHEHVITYTQFDFICTTCRSHSAPGRFQISPAGVAQWHSHITDSRPVSQP
ncbi:MULTISPECIES: hypothetical protein [unclassified Crossiella]|uniref:hypothetical protein n=1 Tax=unclassified Crossiella TaxID=2620835 RepID=UPI001FFE7DCD|nr:MULTISPECIES: hypothetical protein [unclassified Crossiella]MCK2240010.1 hypothetical protein [Crossiella sp. S99.2]MCK2252718.1 hypothetical protein [Crossiella sp. S99.1]